MKPFEPMKAATLLAGLATLPYPLYASPKLDGYRATVVEGKLLSKNLLPIRNAALRQRYGHGLLNGLDGELVAGPPHAADAFNRSSRVVTKEAADAEDVAFHVFDMYTAQGGFADRLAQVSARVSLYGAAHGLRLVEHVEVTNAVMAADLEAMWLEAGYEGMMLRSPDGAYKYGRSTLTEGYVVKVKRFADAECVILSCVEEHKNLNADVKDALGRAKRSTRKAGLQASGTLGGFTVRAVNGPYAGKTFRCGTGTLTAEQCAALWAVRDALLGQVFTFKYFPSGTVELPRFPGFLKADWLADLAK